MADPNRMKDILTKHLQAFSSGDWDAYKKAFVDNGIYEEEATHRRVTGADEIVKLVKGWRDAFPDIKATIKEAIASGDALVVEIEWSGTQKGVLEGPLGKIPPTGKFGKLPAVQVVRFDGDKISEMRHYFDLMTLLSQLGVLGQLGIPASPR